MITFLLPMGLVYVAATLVTSGVSHLVRFGPFRDLVRRHGLVPGRMATPVASMTVTAELGCGAAAVALLQTHRPWAAASLFGGSLVMGLSFMGYVRGLLRRPTGDIGCGCSPLAGPLTPAAMVPATALAVVSTLSLVAAAASALVAWDGVLAEPLRALAWLWGATLAAVVILVPAVAPRVVPDGSR